MGIMIAFFLGIPIPYFTHNSITDRYDIADNGKASFVSDNYWRVMFAIPIGFSVL